MTQYRHNIFGGGFGEAQPETIEPDVYGDGWAAIIVAQALPNFAALLSDASAPTYNVNFANVFNNLRNHLAANNPARDSQGIASWTAQLNALSASQAPPTTVRPSIQRPDLAAVVQELYTRYLGRTGDVEGVDYWTGVVINNGANGLADAERGFRVQAVNDGRYTNTTLPAPEYFTLPTTPPLATDGDFMEPPVTTVVEVGGGPGLFDGLADKISTFLDDTAESMGVSRNVLVIGGIAAGVGLFAWMNSESGSSRKR